jgi:hypothetical protein
MRRTKLFFIGVLVLVGFLCLITIFLPSKITISKSARINAGEKAVATEINYFENWKNWYPAFQNKNIRVDIPEQNDSSVAALTNENGQKLTLSILKSTPENIDVLLSDDDGNTKTYQFILSSNAVGQTQVTWNVNIELGWYPWKKSAGIFLDKVTGPRYEAALANLKIALERNGH